MNFRFTTVDSSLNRAEFRWKWVRFLKHSFILGIVLCAGSILVGAALVSGRLTSRPIATALLLLLAVCAFLAWAVIIISAAMATPGRHWLAAALERVDRRLLDRLNTLVFLERGRTDGRSHSFALRIAKQTHGILTHKAPAPAFPVTHAAAHFVVFLIALIATAVLYHKYS